MNYYTSKIRSQFHSLTNFFTNPYGTRSVDTTTQGTSSRVQGVVQKPIIKEERKTVETRTSSPKTQSCTENRFQESKAEGYIKGLMEYLRLLKDSNYKLDGELIKKGETIVDNIVTHIEKWKGHALESNPYLKAYEGLFFEDSRTGSGYAHPADILMKILLAFAKNHAFKKEVLMFMEKEADQLPWDHNTDPIPVSYRTLFVNLLYELHDKTSGYCETTFMKICLQVPITEDLPPEHLLDLLDSFFQYQPILNKKTMPSWEDAFLKICSNNVNVRGFQSHPVNLELMEKRHQKILSALEKIEKKDNMNFIETLRRVYRIAVNSSNRRNITRCSTLLITLVKNKELDNDVRLRGLEVIDGFAHNTNTYGHAHHMRKLWWNTIIAITTDGTGLEKKAREICDSLSRNNLNLEGYNRLIAAYKMTMYEALAQLNFKGLKEALSDVAKITELHKNKFLYNNGDWLQLAMEAIGLIMPFVSIPFYLGLQTILNTFIDTTLSFWISAITSSFAFIAFLWISNKYTDAGNIVRDNIEFPKNALKIIGAIGPFLACLGIYWTLSALDIGFRDTLGTSILSLPVSFWVSYKYTPFGETIAARFHILNTLLKKITTLLKEIANEYKPVLNKILSSILAVGIAYLLYFIIFSFI